MTKLNIEQMEYIEGGYEMSNRECMIAGAATLAGVIFGWTGLGAGLAAGSFTAALAGGCFSN